MVSTHSRPKAAGYSVPPIDDSRRCFNTQPPEGGWFCFIRTNEEEVIVSTHSRPKAAGLKYQPN
nr:MAG TPA: hypothetical protein [Herelleviridae sp.]